MKDTKPFPVLNDNLYLITNFVDCYSTNQYPFLFPYNASFIRIVQIIGPNSFFSPVEGAINRENDSRCMRVNSFPRVFDFATRKPIDSMDEFSFYRNVLVLLYSDSEV